MLYIGLVHGLAHEFYEHCTRYQVMGPKKRSYITRTATFTPSPISAIFWGQLRYVLHQAGGLPTANLQPFTTLPLDIQVRIQIPCMCMNNLYRYKVNMALNYGNCILSPQFLICSFFYD